MSAIAPLASPPLAAHPPVQSGDVALMAEARAVRQDVARALFATGGGHYGGCFSVTDLLVTLYRRVLRVDPRAPANPGRDRLILSKGHAALALYAVLRRVGFFDDPLEGYADFGSRLEGHPDMLTVPGVDFSTGSLGQGLSVGFGMAHALRGTGSRVWVVLGDGECQEGQVWEAAMLAGMSGLDNLVAVIDFNRFQEWGWNPRGDEFPPPLENHAEKWRSFGWSVLECNGHDFTDLEATFAAATVTGGPTVVIASTVKGRGSPMCESDPKRFHCDGMDAVEHARLMEELR